jgi:hypothetical protein
MTEDALFTINGPALSILAATPSGVANLIRTPTPG